MRREVQKALPLEGGAHPGPLFAPRPRKAQPRPYSTTLPGRVRRGNERLAQLTYSAVRKQREDGISGWRRRKEQYDKLPWWEQFNRDVQAVYKEARRLTKLTGVVHSVDHIVPLKHKLVCGLHVSWNMRVITLDDNLRKANNWWPDMPMMQLDLLPDE